MCDQHGIVACNRRQVRKQVLGPLAALACDVAQRQSQLPTHAARRAFDHALCVRKQHAIAIRHRRCAITQREREQACVLRMERDAQIVGRQRRQSVERTDGMQRRRSLPLPNQGAKPIDRSSILPLHQQLLREVATNSVSFGQCGDELERRRRFERRVGARTRPLRCDAPDAALADRLLQLSVLDLLPQERRDEVLVLDHASSHVDDIQRAIGPLRQVDRPEAFVRRSQELRAVVTVDGLHLAVDIAQPEATDEIARRLADEHIAVAAV